MAKYYHYCSTYLRAEPPVGTYRFLVIFFAYFWQLGHKVIQTQCSLFWPSSEQLSDIDRVMCLQDQRAKQFLAGRHPHCEANNVPLVIGCGVKFASREYPSFQCRSCHLRDQGWLTA